MLKLGTFEDLIKTMDKYCTNKIKKWNEKSEYHLDKSMYYMYKHATIWDDMKSDYHYLLAVYYINCANGGAKVIKWGERKASELNTNK